ncbi:hypothetical protein VPH35_061255 [Triticum aestivum]|uniref:uncharacterized protein n=1 Tax=Triticum aestivum TaxID=4565 RepID=UPI00098A0F8F|nr:uncharacterized protein LOC109731565 [Aegilops tauschii subsp. strangulata]XP_044358211.1 uncharacterized protein LOC123079502 [Triticum aestivum]
MRGSAPHRTEQSPTPDPAPPGFSPTAATVVGNRLVAAGIRFSAATGNRLAAAGSCLRAATGNRIAAAGSCLHAAAGSHPNLRRQEVALSVCYNLKKWRARKPKLLNCLYKTRVNWIAAGRVL